MQVWFPERTQPQMPKWLRLTAGWLCFSVGILMLVQHPSDLMWGSQLFLGMWFLFMPPFRQPGESRKDYYTKPRVLFSTIVLVIAFVASFRNLYIDIVLRK